MKEARFARPLGVDPRDGLGVKMQQRKTGSPTITLGLAKIAFPLDAACPQGMLWPEGRVWPREPVRACYRAGLMMPVA
jgi:hypothetical protein